MRDPILSLVNAIKWSFLAELAAKAVQPIVFIVLARLLAPEDFGVMSAALMVVSFAQIFWDAGMGKALIQRQTDVDEAANVAFWINVGLASAISVLLYTTSGVIAKNIFHDERVIDVLRTMSLYVLIGGACAVHSALLQKQMGFKKLFWIRFTTIGLPGLASIPLAANGLGYWALVIGTLVGQAAQAALYWYLNPWRPKWSIRPRFAREMAGFGGWVGASGLLGWLFGWADSLIVGANLGSQELGLYRTGSQIPAMIFALIFGPVLPVFYSYMSSLAPRNQPDTAKLIENIVKCAALIAIPVGFIISALASSVVVPILGDAWNGIEVVIVAVSITNAFAWVVGLNGEIYRAYNKPHFETAAMASALLLYVPTYLICASYDLTTFVAGRFAVTLIGLIVQLYFLARITNINIWPIFAVITRSSIIMSLCLVPTASLLETARPQTIAIITAICISLSLSLLYYMEIRRRFPMLLKIFFQSRIP